jgi:type IV secretion system protein VirB9
MKYPAAALALALLAVSGQAAADPRLKTIAHQADKVVPVEGRLGFQSMIEFAPGEQIENVAVGNSEAWQVTPNKRANLLFLKPLTIRAKTNMTVVTDQRVYLFDLSVASARGEPLYNLSFTYDAPRTGPSAATKLATRMLEAPPAVAQAPVVQAQATASRRLNFAWKGKGKKELLPTQTYDDGHSVFLQWKAGTPLPALLTPGADGTEGPLSYRQVGQYIVIDQVPQTLVIRLGSKSATLINRNPANRIAER